MLKIKPCLFKTPRIYHFRAYNTKNIIRGNIITVNNYIKSNNHNHKYHDSEIKRRLYGTKGYGSVLTDSSESKKDPTESHSQDASGRRESVLENDEKEKGKANMDPVTSDGLSPQQSADDSNKEKKSKSSPGSAQKQPQQERDPEDAPTPYDSQAPAASESSSPSETFDPVKKKFVPVSEERYKNKTEKNDKNKKNKEVDLGSLSDGHAGAATSGKRANRKNTNGDLVAEIPSIQSAG
ncbi:1331_t:CDS:2 [Ambispora leptoticha]|uniref:1331_t:CDS:1 n=1 Tax=Ambispora leptoticha TaxID=144679 RepID=A0A9N8V9H5_9GLOM|nr:1331_t:CDS:2 [Ambispora leptoticha]